MNTFTDGDQAWITSLMDIFGTDVQRQCFAFLKDYALAEDAAQDTFIKAYRAYVRNRYPNTGMEKSWLMRIALNTCKDYHRTAWFRHVDRKTPLDENNGGFAELSPPDQQILHEVLDLPKKEKEVIFLHHYQKMSADEIATTLSISRATVFNRLKAA
ncbi:MAG: sigma-70 family RNA polymerase sigma factor, partial [Oscillospiraceae bacterium]|nr:sigma-70 family RNA polymerase sigma factor [Oscillospiraceae bacterium]